MLENWQNEAVAKFPTFLPGRSYDVQPDAGGAIADRIDYVSNAVRTFQNSQAPR